MDMVTIDKFPPRLPKMLKYLLILSLHGLIQHLATASSSNGPDSEGAKTNVARAQHHAETTNHPFEDDQIGTRKDVNEAVGQNLPRKSPLLMEISKILSDCGTDICYTTGEILPTFLMTLNAHNYYIDKTLLIEKFLQSNNKPLAVTAPSRFGKTLNLQMMQAFFQCPVSVNGTRIPKEKSVTYKVFELLEIGKSPFFKYFGTRPVIYFDFQHLQSFESAEEVTEKLNLVLTESVMVHHPYIKCFTDNDTVSFREDCLKGDVKPDTLNFCILWFGTVLKNFYSMNPLVLIDEFGAPHQYLISKAGRYLTTEFITESTSTIANFVATPGKKYLHKIFWRVYTSGVMRFGETYSYFMNNLVYKSIFQEASLAALYGFTKPDVDKLAKFFGLDAPQKSKILELFDGYGVYDTTKTEQRLFCPGALMAYIESGCPHMGKSELTEFFYGQPLDGFENLISMHRLGPKVLESLKPDANLTVDVLGKITLDELLLLRDAEITGESGKKRGRIESYFFYYLMENGLYSGKKICDSFSLTIPNEVSRAMIENSILQRKYFDSIFKCTDSEIRDFKDNVKKLTDTTKSLVSLTESIARLFTHPSSKMPDTEFELGAPLYTYMVEQPKNHIDAQLYFKATTSDPRRYIDIFYHRNDGMYFLIETRRYTKKDKVAKRDHTSLKPLQDIIDRNYIERLQQPDVKQFLLVGIFMNETILQCGTLANTFNMSYAKTHTVKLDQMGDLNKYDVKTKGAGKIRKKGKTGKRR